MKNRYVCIFAVLLVVWLGAVTAGHASFLGDLVYCDQNANGVFDAGDYGLNGVDVRATCTAADGSICYDATFVTGSDPSGTSSLEIFAGLCGADSTWDPLAGPQDGRYIHEIFEACWSAFAPEPWTCAVTVDPNTLPDSCNVLVTPRANGFPLDGNDDGDRCDAEDGPFPEGQVLGNPATYGGCEAYPDAAPSNGSYTVTVDPVGADECNMYNDFGYTPHGGADGCTPGFWKGKNHQDAWADTGYTQGDDFDTTFGVDFFDPDITLFEALNLGGGGVNKVARHGTAALLNAGDPAVDYPLTEAQVIAAVQAQNVDQLVVFNELSDDCPQFDD